MHYVKRAAEERNLTSIVSLHRVNIAREFGERFIGHESAGFFETIRGLGDTGRWLGAGNDT